MSAKPSRERPETPGDEREGGFNAGWIILGVVLVFLGLGIAFFVVASQNPVELVKP